MIFNSPKDIIKPVKNKSKIKTRKRWTLESSCENLVQRIILLRVIKNTTLCVKDRRILTNNQKQLVKEALERHRELCERQDKFLQRTCARENMELASSFEFRVKAGIILAEQKLTAKSYCSDCVFENKNEHEIEYACLKGHDCTEYNIYKCKDFKSSGDTSEDISMEKENGCKELIVLEPMRNENIPVNFFVSNGRIKYELKGWLAKIMGGVQKKKIKR